MCVLKASLLSELQHLSRSKTLSSEVYLSLRPAGRHKVTPTKTWDRPALGVMRPQAYPKGYLHGVWQPTLGPEWAEYTCCCGSEAYVIKQKTRFTMHLGWCLFLLALGFCGCQTGRPFLRCPSRLSDSWDPGPSPAHATHLLITGAEWWGRCHGLPLAQPFMVPILLSLA